MALHIVQDIHPIGIVDIGSNTVRLCVYEATSRVPVPMYNEKAVCALGRGLAGSGRLNPQGVICARAAVERFVTLARAMAVERLDILATSAVRDAEDGPAFVAELEQAHGVTVQVLSGGEEAEMAAYGVLCGLPEADGIVADLGGGSLELVNVRRGEPGKRISLPLGVLRLSDLSGDDHYRAALVVKSYLEEVAWLHKGAGRNLYVVGGSWRALARLFMSRIHHPLMVLDNFSLPAAQALPLVEAVATQGRKGLEKVPGIPSRRLQTMPMAALVLEHLLRMISPERLVFSIFGMREGRFFSNLPESVRSDNPLLWMCRRMAALHARFPEHGEELMGWTAPLFPQETPAQARLRHATALVSDIFWDEHPDYRAEQAFLRILRLPFMGVSHADRAAVAYAVYCRYQGGTDTPQAQIIAAMLDPQTLQRCQLLGQALRLAHTLSGGAPDLLRGTRLVPDGETLVVEMSPDVPDLDGQKARLLNKLAKSLDLSGAKIRRTEP